MKRRVLIIGLDGATLDLVAPWAHSGQLPSLRRLIDTGAWGPLASTVPPVTSPAWPTFATGKNPGKHGVFDYIRPKGTGYDLVNASAVDGEMLWEILSRHGRRVIVINVPVTYPPRPVNGMLVAGLLSPPGSTFTYPADALSPYQARLGRYRISPSVQYKPGNEDAFLADLLDLVRTRGAFARAILREQPWDFAMVHFLATDIAQHALWRWIDPEHPRYTPEGGARYGDYLLRIFQQVDREIATLLELVGPETTIFVMSDHGFGPLHRTANLNIHLMNEGLLALKPNWRTRLRYHSFRLGITPSNIYRLMTRLHLQNLTWRISKRARNAALGRFFSFSDVDWSRTVAFSMGHVGQIYLNVRGRQPHGIVDPADYERTRERVIEALKRLRDPQTGRPIVDQILPREEVAEGPHLDEGPDLHVVMDGYRCIAFPLFASSTQVIAPQIRGDSGCHRSHGLLIASGPAINPGSTPQNAHLVDLAPTVLYLLGCPIPDDMDGRVLTELITSDFAQHPPQYEQSNSHATSTSPLWGNEDEEAIADRLRGLGYLG